MPRYDHTYFNSLIGKVDHIEDHGDGLKVYVDLRESETNVNKYQPKYSGNYLPPITKVIFNGPATVVFFADGDKIVVKCSETDDFDPYVGICMAITKKAYQNRSANYMIKHLVDRYYPSVPVDVIEALMDSARKALGILRDD